MNSLEQKELLKDNEIRKLKMRLDEANARIAVMERVLQAGLRLSEEPYTLPRERREWESSVLKVLPSALAQDHKKG